MRTRKHIRLRNFDYSSQARYFITICTKNRRHTLGEIKDGIMHLSAIGKQAELYWNEIPEHFPHIELGEFIIMPNHIHGIIGIVDTPQSTAERARQNTTQLKQKSNIQIHNTTLQTRHVVSQLKENKNYNDSQREFQSERMNQFGKTIAGSLSAIIGQFKSTLTRWSRKNGYPDFAWQGRFHDHIIRNEGAFQRISNYIKNNPANWDKDKSR